MGTDSKIEWTDHTWNPWRGCTKVSAGCDNCYMMRILARYGQQADVVHRAAHQTFSAPIHRSRSGSWKWADGSKVFMCSMSDFFHPDADSYRPECWDIIRKRRGLIFQILTKRPERIARCLPNDWGRGYPNVWLGVTAEDQAMLDRRMNILAHISAAKRFVSVEPMLQDIRLDRYGVMIDWVIVGCETGPHARRLNFDWVRSIRDYCFEADIPLFVKQLHTRKAIPDDLRIFEFPLDKPATPSLEADATINQRRDIEESERRLREIDLKARIDLLPESEVRDMVFATLAALVRKYGVRGVEALAMQHFARSKVISDWQAEAQK